MITVLNKLINATNAGVADKVGYVKLKVRLSMLAELHRRGLF